MGRRRSLRQVVKVGWPLERLNRTGYSGRVCAAVVEVLLARSDDESRFQDLTASTGLNHASVRLVCRDLEALGHLVIRVERSGYGSVWAGLWYRLTPDGVALWRARQEKLGGSLLLPVREPTLVLAKVMGARLDAAERARGFSRGYAFPTLERVVRVMLGAADRAWKVAEIAPATRHAIATVSLVCRDLVAAGHADRQAEMRRDGLPLWCRYRLTPEAVGIWATWFEGDD